MYLKVEINIINISKIRIYYGYNSKPFHSTKKKIMIGLLNNFKID